MSYKHPSTVTSPQERVSKVRPIANMGEWEWSAALLKWDNSDGLGLRWNGGTREGEDKPHPGAPQSRGIPTWFVVPEVLMPAVLQGLLDGDYLGGDSIDKAEATKWVKEALDNKTQKLQKQFTNRVRQVVREMQAAGEI